MKRRAFIALLGGAAGWPLAARAQEVKRLGVLWGSVATDPTEQSHLRIFMQGLRKLGWIDGQNLQIEVRWSASDLRLMEAYATDLVRLFKPDVATDYPSP
jgi:putative tryptophan/tyrosine transport system substrate-binding protein